MPALKTRRASQSNHLGELFCSHEALELKRKTHNCRGVSVPTAGFWPHQTRGDLRSEFQPEDSTWNKLNFAWPQACSIMVDSTAADFIKFVKAVFWDDGLGRCSPTTVLVFFNSEFGL